jgi:AcrR family transcriptional regulator
MRRKKAERAQESSLEIAERRRADLLEAAFSLIAERGLEGLRTRDVARLAGVNISTLHYYFGTKEALLVAVVEYASTKFSTPPPGRGRLRADGGQGLRAHFDSAWRNFQATPELSIVLQELVLRGQRSAQTRAAFRALYEGWNQLVEGVVREQIEQGVLRADLDPRAAARIVTSFIIGATVQLGVNPKAFDFVAVARNLEEWLEK